MIAGVICACMLLGNIEAPIVASAASSDEAYTLTSMQDDMDHEMEEDELEEVPGNVDETEFINPKQHIRKALAKAYAKKKYVTIGGKK